LKRATSIFLLLFLVAAVSLFIIIYIMPKIQGGSQDTVVLENRSLPIADTEDVLIVRSETLYASPLTGSADYTQEDGDKVRKGVLIMSVSPGEAPDDENDEVAKIKDIAGKDMVTTDNFEAAKTGIICFTADGYEKKLTPELITELKPEDIENIPKKGISLQSEKVREGDPIYKLTDGALWYIVFWLDGASGSRVHYDEGDDVKVDFGDAVVNANVDSITDSDGDFRVVLSSDRYYKNMESDRRVKASIISEEYKGLVIDATSIALRDDQPGVFVKQRSGSFKWVSIQIDEKHSTGTEYIVSVGTYVDADGSTVHTVNYYDEILTDPRESGYE
jgi:putative membrane fusion protein